MTKKPIKRFALALLAMLLCCGVAACNMAGGGNNNTGNNNTGDTGNNNTGDNGNTGNNNTGDNGNTGTQSDIKSLTENEASYSMKVGENLLLTNCYTIEGNVALSAAKKQCTYESSNPEIVKIEEKTATAVDSGKVTITVTSKADPTKSCSFEIVVGKTFIDRNASYTEEDDFAHEWDDENDKPGWFRTTSMLSQNYYNVKGVKGTVWYVQTTIKVHEFGILADTQEKDRWPKIGIATMDAKNKENMVAFFMSATIGINDRYDDQGNLIKGQDNLNWNEFGMCEVTKGHWAWESEVASTEARYQNCAYTTPETFSYNQEFTIGVSRIGLDFHIYINGVYAYSFQLDPSLEILTDGTNPVDSTVAFYGFSTDATFSNYYATTNEAEINAKYKPLSPAWCGFTTK